MKPFLWSWEKNRFLQETRGISFEEVVFHIDNGDLLAVIDHWNQDRYSDQKIFIVRVDDYAYLVPFVETDDEIFLKTIIPSRKATRDYLGDD